MAGKKKGGLGRGLEALFADVEIPGAEPEKVAKATLERTSEKKTKTKNEVETGDSVVFVDLNDIKPNASQPRKTFDQEKLEELAASITEHGVIQPVVLRAADKGYELVAGERRWRAARLAGLKKVPAIVKELTEEQNMLIAIIENLQRENLNPIEEAEGLNSMIKAYGLTQEQVAKSVGKSRPYITNSLRLLKLPDEIREYLLSGSLSMGHARALAGLDSKEKQIEIANRAVREGLSVRAVEDLSQGKGLRRKPRKKVTPKDVNAAQVEKELKDIIGTKVRINQNGKKGRIEIEYYSRDDLERIIEMLMSLN